jgi:hypothetical protein
LDRIRDEYNALRQQLQNARVELERHAQEKENLQRQAMVYFEMLSTCNLEVAKHMEIAKRLSSIVNGNPSFDISVYTRSSRRHSIIAGRTATPSSRGSRPRQEYQPPGADDATTKPDGYASEYGCDGNGPAGL